MVYKVLSYLVQNRASAIVLLLISQFLPILSSISVMLQSFYIINKGVRYSLPLILASSICNQFVPPLLMDNPDTYSISRFIGIFLLAHISFLAISAIFSIIKSFEYTALSFATLSYAIILFAEHQYGFDGFINFVSSNFNLTITSEMVKEMLSILFLSYSFLSLVFGILLENKYYSTSYQLTTGLAYLAIIIVLIACRLSGFIDVFVLYLFGVAVVVSSLSSIYDLIKSARYASIFVSVASLLAVMYLEIAIYASVLFQIWDFYKKRS